MGIFRKWCVMAKDLKDGKILVGVKQSSEAIVDGLAKKAYLADDTDSFVAVPFKELCEKHNIEIVRFESKKLLGKACKINVSAACAVLLK